MSYLTLTSRERAALAKVAEQPRPLGEVASEHVEILIGHGLVRRAIGHYLITPRGQLERQRQSFRATVTGKRAHVDGRRFLFLQEARFQSESVPRSRIKEWLQSRRAPEGENDIAPADAETWRPGALVGRLRAYVTSRSRQSETEPIVETPTVPAEPKTARLLPIPFVGRPKDPEPADEMPDGEFELAADGRY